MTAHACVDCRLSFASLLAAAAGGRQTACRDDLDQGGPELQPQPRSELQKAASAVPAAKCAAYRKHVASLNERAQECSARCDTSPNKAQNAARINADIAEFSKQTRSIVKK